jgi:hypothetical protein
MALKAEKDAALTDLRAEIIPSSTDRVSLRVKVAIANNPILLNASINNSLQIGILEK